MLQAGELSNGAEIIMQPTEAQLAAAVRAAKAKQATQAEQDGVLRSIFSAAQIELVDEWISTNDPAIDRADAIRRLKEVLPTIANVVAEPKPDVEILTFNERGPVLAVRPYCNTAHYWQVYFDTNRLIREEFQLAGYSAPEQHYSVRGVLDPLSQRGLGTAA